MAEVFGTEQELSSRPAQGPSDRSINITQKTPFHFDMSGLDSLSNQLSKMAKQKQDMALGADLAAANDQISSVTSIVGKQETYDRLTNVLLKKYGASAGDEIKRSLTYRKLEQRVVDGVLANVDKDSGTVVSTRKINNDPSSEVSEHIVNQTPDFQANFPRTAGAWQQIFGHLNQVGGQAGNFDQHDLLKPLNRFNDLPYKIQNAVLESTTLKRGLLGRGDVTIAALEEEKKNLERDVTNSALVALTSFNNPSVFKVIRDGKNKVSPDVMGAVVDSAISDVMEQMNEQGAFKALNMDANKFYDNMTKVGNTIKASYAAQDDLKVLERNQKKMDAYVAIAKDEVLLNVAKNNPKMFELIQTAPGVTAAANLTTALDNLGNNYTSLSRGGKGVARTIEDLFTRDQAASNLIRLNKLDMRTGIKPEDTWGRVLEAYDLTSEAMKDPRGTLYAQQYFDWWTKHEKDLTTKFKGKPQEQELQNMIREYLLGLS